MKNKNRQTRKETRRYITDRWRQMIGACYLIKYYEIIYETEKANDQGGHFGVHYSPCNFEAKLYIYDDVFDQPSGLTKEKKSWIDKGLTHELGHILIWELEGSYKTLEKTASEIGWFIFKWLKETDDGRKN